jgi:hypothetical protein
MLSGKGERLVILTVIRKEYSIPLPIDHQHDENKMLKALLVFKASKSSGDYHQQMLSNILSVTIPVDKI